MLIPVLIAGSIAMTLSVAGCGQQRFEAAKKLTRNTRVFVMSPPKRGVVWFEAEYRQDLVLMGGKITQWKWPMWNFLTVSPHLRLRMYKGESAPVRPPSFLPRADWYHLVRMGSKGAPWAGVQLTVGHHSNGQDGCTLTNDENEEPEFDLPEGTRMGACPQLTEGERRINHLNGTFGLNFIRGSVPFFMEIPCPGKGENVCETHLLTVSHDFKQFSVDDDTRRFYPHTRTGIEYMHEHSLDPDDYGKSRPILCAKKRSWTHPWTWPRLCGEDRIFGARVEGVARYDVEEDDFFPGSWSRDLFSLEGELWLADGHSGMGMFIGGYVGRDYYNITFDEWVTIAQVGFIWRHRGLRDDSLDRLGKPTP